MTISYPDDRKKADGKDGEAEKGEGRDGEVKKETFGVGARVDVEQGRRHEVWMGGEGCEYVIGEK